MTLSPHEFLNILTNLRANRPTDKKSYDGKTFIILQARVWQKLSLPFKKSQHYCKHCANKFAIQLSMYCIMYNHLLDIQWIKLQVLSLLSLTFQAQYECHLMYKTAFNMIESLHINHWTKIWTINSSPCSKMQAVQQAYCFPEVVFYNIEYLGLQKSQTQSNSLSSLTILKPNAKQTNKKKSSQHHYFAAGDKKILKSTANTRQTTYPTMHSQKRGSLRSFLL